MKKYKILFIVVVVLIFCSCIKHKSLYQGEKVNSENYSDYCYPFSEEIKGINAEILIQTKEDIDWKQVEISIPPLKYNKAWLFTLTQDDCKQDAYSCTWAAMNGRPLTKKYYYDFRQFINDDLPPDVYYLGKTLGSTDGAGNEVRFNFTTTLSPEWEFMNAKSVVSPGLSQNYYRFFMKSGLVWENVIDMVNYGTAISFHDVNTNAVKNVDSIIMHFAFSQDSILRHLSGRECKFLVEPNGNKIYISAAQEYAPIQIMTAQDQTVRLFPFQVQNDLKKTVIHRVFSDVSETKKFILSQLELEKEMREAVNIGVHGTSTDWVQLFLWLNDEFGKDGDDSMWFTSLEEYYEYNYYRIHATFFKDIIDNRTLKLKINLPVEKSFYYPSITLNMVGVSASSILSVSANNPVKGMSYGAYEQGLMINIDCRKKLIEHTTHFVEQYEKNPTEITRRDALYFIGKLKESSQKEALKKRIK